MDTDTTTTTKTRIRAFIIENFYVQEGAMLDDDTSLLGSGVVDSTGVLEVVAFLEESFDISVPDADIVPDNLDTIGRLDAYVTRMRTAA